MATASFPESASGAYITQTENNGSEGSEGSQGETSDIPSQPSLDFTRKTWWDSLISLYLSPDSERLHSLTTSQRDFGAQQIWSDLRFLFNASHYWFSFFHIPSFFGSFCDPVRRSRIQPSLVFGLLAVSTFWQSSEVDRGASGRERALCFRDEAQSALEASFNAGWIDETLAQAAWVIYFLIVSITLTLRCMFFSYWRFSRSVRIPATRQRDLYQLSLCSIPSFAPFR